jgi:hypothetical protein
MIRSGPCWQVPLYYLLRNVARDVGAWEKLDSGHGTAHRSMVHDLQAQLDLYINSILSRQQPDGWFGPPARAKKGGNEFWARSNLMLALAQLAEAEPERAPAIIDAMLRYMRCLQEKLRSTGLQEWASARWPDLAL